MMLTGYKTPLHYIKPIPNQGHPHKSDLSRLLAAAVINPGFCQLLLQEPARALAQGFQGESFPLSREERDLVLSIRAESLEDFARQLCSHQEITTLNWIVSPISIKQPALIME